MPGVSWQSQSSRSDRPGWTRIPGFNRLCVCGLMTFDPFSPWAWVQHWTELQQKKKQFCQGRRGRWKGKNKEWGRVPQKIFWDQNVQYTLRISLIHKAQCLILILHHLGLELTTLATTWRSCCAPELCLELAGIIDWLSTWLWQRHDGPSAERPTV